MADGACLPNGAMAWDEIRQGVPAGSSAHSPRRIAIASSLSQLPIADQLPPGDAEQGAPDPNLEATATDEGAQRQLVFRAGGRHENRVRKPRGDRVVPVNTRLRPVVLDCGRPCLPVPRLDEGEMADPAWALANQTSAKWTVGEAGSNRPRSPARFEFTRRGGLEFHTEVVQAAGPG